MHKYSKIFKQITFGLGSILVLVGITACGSKQDQLVLGTSADYPPFESMAAGKIVGLDIDIMNALSEATGKELVIKEMDFPALIPAVMLGKVDVVAAGITKTQKRAESVAFTDAYFDAFPMGLLYHSNNPVESMQNLKGKKVGVQLGSYMEVQLDDSGIEGVEKLALPKNDMLVQELKLSHVDAVLLSSYQAEQYANANRELEAVSTPTQDSGCHLVLQKGSELIEPINAALAELRATGKLHEIKVKWFGGDDVR